MAVASTKPYSVTEVFFLNVSQEGFSNLDKTVGCLFRKRKEEIKCAGRGTDSECWFYDVYRHLESQRKGLFAASVAVGVTQKFFETYGDNLEKLLEGFPIRVTVSVVKDVESSEPLIFAKFVQFMPDIPPLMGLGSAG
ncbi:MAG: hypothetical protein S4CHLAM45_05330 [Chlamydiales bacterium]|nr:hypothetical protein [Chlamydiales bacterium]MCH9619926.1 hypothetical protein [Chlamydiales bacterium]MCH9622647.1 hypothetical protein [Chlamydiales bacterium]